MLTNPEKEIKDELIESQQLLSEIIDFLPDATLAIDAKGKVIVWNKAIEEMTGFIAEDMMGKGNYEYAVPFYGKRRPILIDLVLKSDKEIEDLYQFIKREGKALLAQSDMKIKGKNLVMWVKAVPLYDSNGNITGAIESIRDITKTKQDEIALKKSKNRFKAFAETATDGIVTSDVHGNILFFNKSLHSMFGYKTEELHGKSLTMLMPERFHASYLDELERFRTRGEHGLLGKTIETTGLKKDGTEFPFEMSLSAWESGDKTYFSAIMRDITNRKKEEEIRKKTEEKYRIIVGKFLTVSNEILQEMNKPIE